MSNSDEARDQEVARVLQDTLNSHGYGFQHAVIRRLHELAEGQISRWWFQAAEVPVEVRGAGTRIDFVLQRGGDVAGAGISAYYMLAECKRANPCYSDWCFAQAPYTTIRSRDGFVILDRARLIDNNRIEVGPIEQYVGHVQHPSYHIGIEIKGKDKGDNQPVSGTSRGAIEDAVTQVFRGTNGMLEFLALNHSLFPGSGKMITLMPVIFQIITRRTE
ncbi:MAG: hypothetical protein M3437_07945 [Chloroflexota bacterium]|nr:hypothetical protein [Chloroflexota bacterium]MDQ5864442.1 hypothetical protein [Chloroflexota bacterium]